ncbi:hypothetical protein MTO96_010726 [Rhipicephalus appendiculatus]
MWSGAHAQAVHFAPPAPPLDSLQTQHGRRVDRRLRSCVEPVAAVLVRGRVLAAAASSRNRGDPSSAARSRTHGSPPVRRRKAVRINNRNGSRRRLRPVVPCMHPLFQNAFSATIEVDSHMARFSAAAAASSEWMRPPVFLSRPRRRRVSARPDPVLCPENAPGVSFSPVSHFYPVFLAHATR